MTIGSYGGEYCSVGSKKKKIPKNLNRQSAQNCDWLSSINTEFSVQLFVRFCPSDPLLLGLMYVCMCIYNDSPLVYGYRAALISY